MAAPLIKTTTSVEHRFNMLHRHTPRPGGGSFANRSISLPGFTTPDGMANLRIVRK
jgi:hypothetical protein